MSICVVTCVSENYQHYIPLWAYCLERAYPDYQAMVFLTDPITDKLAWGMQGRRNLRVVKGEFGRRYEHHPPRFAAWCRYLLFTKRRYHYWEPFDWVYITDADMMIVRQEPPLHEQHIKHMCVLGLSYSNMLRDGGRFADKHLTGLHFCGHDFIQSVMDKCTEYDGLFRVNGGGVLDGKPVIYDERLLYQIVRDSGLDFPPHLEDDDLEAENPANYNRASFRPWHGINIGRALNPGWRKNFARAGLPWFREVVASFVALSDDPEFWDCYRMLAPNARQALQGIVQATGQELRTK